jgi:phosphoribosyl 1,2-cyclic phosphate phosphodiesterase
VSDILRFTLLGCGSSPGVPRIGGHWGACDPDEPKNRRRRCSMLVQRIADGGVTNVLVDTSPDLREQALGAGLSALDGVLYTHPHADHLHGIDDLRGFVMNTKRRVDVYAADDTADRLVEGFGYCFKSPPGSDYPPILNLHRIGTDAPVTVDGAGGPVTAMPVVQQHGRIQSLGFRFGGFAYSPDVSGLDADAVARLQGLDVWVVDALRRSEHPSHFSLDQALAWIERLTPRHAVLTHMHHDLDYATLCRELPAHVRPGYDGLVVELAAA